MTIQEARDLLQVGDDLDASSLKRAYLRALKKHTPEQDPEGFRSVRDAYELLGAFQSNGVAAWLETAPKRSAEPDSPEPPTDEAQDLDDDNDSDGDDDEWIFRAKLPAELAGELQVAEAHGALGQSDLEAACKHARQALELSRTDASDHAYLAGLLPIVGRLVAAGRSDEAARLFEDLAETLHQSGAERRLRPEQVTLFALTRELATLPSEFPEPMRRALAEAAALAPFDETAAHERLGTTMRQGRRAAQRAHTMLRKSAPHLFAVFGDAVRPDHPPVLYWFSAAMIALMLVPLHLVVEFDRFSRVAAIVGIDAFMAFAMLYWYDRRRFRNFGIAVGAVVGAGVLFSIFVNVVQPALAGTLTAKNLTKMGALPIWIVFGLVKLWQMYKERRG